MQDSWSISTALQGVRENPGCMHPHASDTSGGD